MINKILIIFPTNLGDVIIGLPVLDKLRVNYPQAKLAVVSSSQSKSFLLKKTFIDEIVIFDKFWKLRQKISFIRDLRGKYDLIVDLKHSALPVMLGAKKRTPLFRKAIRGGHVRDEYLALINRFTPRNSAVKSEFSVSERESDRWRKLGSKKVVFIACSSREKLKRYPYEYLLKVITELLSGYTLAILGVEEDRQFYKDILSLRGVIDLVGKTEMADVYYLLKNYGQLLICADSSIMHLASYLNIPIVALFGVTDPVRYGPWSEKFIIVRGKKLLPAPKKESYRERLEDMKINPAKVLEAIKTMLKEG